MKIMFEKFFPDEYLGSTYKIPFEKLYEQGYRGVIFDIDNTLVPHGAPADERAKRLFQRLREIGFESCLLSNNQKKRVEMFNQEIQTHYIYNALKPARKNYLHAMEIMGLLEKINRRGTTVIVVTHSHEIVDLMKKRVITIDRGMVVCDEEESGYRYED